MSNAENISIALTPEMVATIRGAVATGEYISSGEGVRDAVRDWSRMRAQHAAGIDELRAIWQAALTQDASAYVDGDLVLERLEQKYRALAEATDQ